MAGGWRGMGVPNVSSKRSDSKSASAFRSPRRPGPGLHPQGLGFVCCSTVRTPCPPPIQETTRGSEGVRSGKGSSTKRFLKLYKHRMAPSSWWYSRFLRHLNAVKGLFFFLWTPSSSQDASEWKTASHGEEENP